MRVRGRQAALLVISVVLVLPQQARADDYQLPNFRPRPPYDIQMGKPDPDIDQTASRALRFTVTIDNTGSYPLEIRGIPKTPEELNASEKPAEQCVNWISRVCTNTREVGKLIYHPAHDHWHFDNYALYELRYVAADGTPDFSRPAIVPGNKASFCLEDSEFPPGATVTDAIQNPGIYKNCQSYVQGISPGYGDTYGYWLPGQQLIIDDVPDGTYALVITVNPQATLLETTPADNTSWTLVDLHMCGTPQAAAQVASL